MITGLMKNNFTQKLATGAAALGVLAGVGLAALPARAALIGEYINPSGISTGKVPVEQLPTISLQNLLDGGMIGVWHEQDPFHLWFNDFDNFISAGSGGAVPVDPNEVFVTPRKSPDPYSGIRLTFNSGNFLAPVGNSSQETSFDYSVWAHDDGKQISDIHLSLGGHSVDDGGAIIIAESVDSPGQNIDDLLVCDDKRTPLLCPFQPGDWHDINPPVRHLEVNKDIFLHGGIEEPTFLSDFHQDFTKPVPEPGTILGLLAFGGLGLGLKRKKQG